MAHPFGAARRWQSPRPDAVMAKRSKRTAAKLTDQIWAAL